MRAFKRRDLLKLDEHSTVAGQGTVGLEVIKEIPDLDTIFVPIGGGGLISWISIAVKSISPKTRVIGVQPEGSCSMLESLRNNELSETENCNTIADGLRVKKPGENTFYFVKKYVDEIITVSDKEIKAALLLLLQRSKLLVEPSGATSLAGLLSNKIKLGEKNLAILSGGNYNMTDLEEILNQYNNLVK